MSSKNKPNLEQINNLKNMVSGNLLEFIKPQIKNHQNENVLKIMDMIHEHPDIWLEFLSLSIVHKNFSIMKYMIETFRINPNQKSFLNSLTFYNDILPDNSHLRINDHKELFIDIEVPFEILCAIGGDKEIFDYLKQKKFIKNSGNSSVIGLTKKQKNAFYSNAIGACCYYGRYEFLKNIINNNLNIDFETTEKKAKNKHISFNKEFTDYTPIFLAIASEIAKEDESIECIKILNEAKCNLDQKDFEKNNILHIAVKNKKIKILKFLIENLDLKNLINETNKKGQTPSGIAINEGFSEITEYLKSYNVLDENLQKDLEDLINEEEGKKKKGKKKKKKDKEKFNLLNSTEYQESLKIENKEEKTHDDNNNNKNKIEEENEEEEEEEDEENYNNNYNNNYYSYNNNNYEEYDNNYNNNYDNVNNNRNYRRNKNGYSRYNNNNNYNNNYYRNNNNNNYNNNRYNNNKKFYSKEIEEDFNNKNKVEDEIDDENKKKEIIGLTKKKNKKKNKKKDENYKKIEKELINQIEESNNNNDDNNNEENDKTKKVEIEPENFNENLSKKKVEIEPEEEIITTNNNNEINNNDNINKEEKNEIETKNISSLKNEEEKEEEEENKNEEIPLTKVEKLKEEEEKNNNNNKEEEYEESSYDDENFLNDSNHDNNNNNNNITNEKYTNLLNKFYELQKNFQSISKEKNELENFIKKEYLKNKRNNSIPSTEENINDLLYLANKELEEKNKIIEELNSQIKFFDLKNIKNFSLNKLNEIKEKYNNDLTLINNAINSYNH